MYAQLTSVSANNEEMRCLKYCDYINSLHLEVAVAASHNPHFVHGKNFFQNGASVRLGALKEF
jgi:hypothetical protein